MFLTVDNFSVIAEASALSKPFIPPTGLSFSAFHLDGCILVPVGILTTGLPLNSTKQVMGVEEAALLSLSLKLMPHSIFTALTIIS